MLKVGMNSNVFKNAPPPTPWIPLLYGTGIIVIAALLTWGIWLYMKEQLRSKLMATATTSPSSSPSSSPTGQWCFVGEDMTGRWCVKTPEEGLCPQKRVFQSRSECEMKTASASPLGINQDHDTTMIPIAGLSIA
jgi:hypothetical protein